MTIADTIVNLSFVIVAVHPKPVPGIRVVVKQARVSIMVVMVTKAHVQRVRETIPRIEGVKYARMRVVMMAKNMMYGTRNSVEKAS